MLKGAAETCEQIKILPIWKGPWTRDIKFLGQHVVHHISKEEEEEEKDEEVV